MPWRPPVPMEPCSTSQGPSHVSTGKHASAFREAEQDSLIRSDGFFWPVGISLGPGCYPVHFLGLDLAPY